MRLITILDEFEDELRLWIFEAANLWKHRSKIFRVRTQGGTAKMPWLRIWQFISRWKSWKMLDVSGRFQKKERIKIYAQIQVDIFPQAVSPHWGVLTVSVLIVPGALGIFPVNFPTKWFLWNVHVHFDCASSQKNDVPGGVRGHFSCKFPCKTAPPQHQHLPPPPQHPHHHLPLLIIIINITILINIIININIIIKL